MDIISPCVSAGEERHGLITHVSDLPKFSRWMIILFLDIYISPKLFMIYGIYVNIKSSDVGWLILKEQLCCNPEFAEREF
jgi:hypothetical protein